MNIGFWIFLIVVLLATTTYYVEALSRRLRNASLRDFYTIEHITLYPAGKRYLRSKNTANTIAYDLIAELPMRATPGSALSAFLDQQDKTAVLGMRKLEGCFTDLAAAQLAFEACRQSHARIFIPEECEEIARQYFLGAVEACAKSEARRIWARGQVRELAHADPIRQETEVQNQAA